jgi:putative membrane-bound dehydrogenase-like protein
MKATCVKHLLTPLLLVGLLAHSAAGEVGFERKDGRLHVTVDGQPFAVYVWDDTTTTRPYFMQVQATGGEVQITRNHPPASGDFDDHATFHPGLWWGFGDVGGNDYWRLKARVVGGDFVEEPQGGEDRGQFVVRNRLLMNDGDATFCEQLCRYIILQRPQGILMVCESTLRREGGDFWLGDQEEMGLAVRVATPLAMASNQGGCILNSDGVTDLSQIRTRQSEWCDYSGPVAGQHGGMLLMNDPENFREPWWHAVKTGLLIANPLGESELNGRGKRRQNVLVKAGESFRLRYGVLIHLSNDANAFDPAEAYRDFLSVLPTLKPGKEQLEEPNANLPRVPDGFEVSIYAREPLVYKPTSLCFDARGRLFIGQGPQYPKNDDGSPTDSVYLLTDSDDDGVADKAKEFAQGLNSIQGLAWKGNDLYVANSPELTLVRDLDGDDQADEYVVIYTDLGNREHALHGLNFGPDGKLYMSKGNSKGHNQPEKYGYVAPRPFRELWDVEHPPGAPDAYPPKVFTQDAYRKTYHHWDDDWGREGGVLRCDPLGENLEIVSRGLRNPWDIAMDDGFNWLGTDNDQTQGDRIIMPFFAAHFGWGHRYSSHWSGAGNLPTVPVSGPLFSGSGAGIIYYAHEHFPPQYQNVFFINDWLFGTYVYRPNWNGALRTPADGSLEPFMQRSEGGMLYRPTDLEFGPDGAIYTLGWGGHYQYERGKEGSWIFRITHRGADQLVAPVASASDRPNETNQRRPAAASAASQPEETPLVDRSVAQLLKELGPEILPARRVNAQDELVRRGEASCDQMVAKISGSGLTTGQQTWAVWALGQMKGTDTAHSEVFRNWASPKARIPRNLRIQALRILGYRARWFSEKEALFAAVKMALPDADPRLRFEAIQAIHQARLTRATGDVVEQLSKEADRLVFYSGWQALRNLAPLEQRRSWLDHKNARVRLAALLGLQEDYALTQEEALALVDRDSAPAVQSWALTFAMNPRPPARMPNTTTRVELEQTVPIGQMIERARAAADRPTLRLLNLRMISRASVRGGKQQQELLEFYRTLATEEERTLVLPATATTLDALPDLWAALGAAAPLQNAAVEGISNLVNRRTAGLSSAEKDLQAVSRSLSSVSASAAEIANRLLDKIAEAGACDERVAGALQALDSLPLPQDWSVAKDELDALLTILDSRNEPSIRRPVLRLLRKLDPGEAASSERVAVVLKALCQVPDAHLYRDLVAAVAHLGLGIEVPAPQAATASGVLARLARADADRGEEIFFDPVRGADCAACHRVRGRGSALAPDLSGVGTRLTPANMVKSIFEPSAAITEGYAMQLLLTADGKAHTGAVIRETESAITLLRTDGRQVTVETSAIEKRKKLNQSVMPKGYELFGNEQLADLTAWLLTLRNGGSESTAH